MPWQHQYKLNMDIKTWTVYAIKPTLEQRIYKLSKYFIFIFMNASMLDVRPALVMNSIRLQSVVNA